MREINFTGERVVPGKVDKALWDEHIARYIFAADFIKGRVVLDAGCGSGYGTDYLASCEAQQVIGVDISPEAVAYAQSHYKRQNLEFRIMDVTGLDLADKSFDVIVSFEVIEHLNHQEKFLSEVARILKDEGTFIVSTPNKEANPPGYVNPFHTREFTLGKFYSLLKRYFRSVEILLQNYILGIAIAPPHMDKIIVDHSLANEERPPQYFLALCGQITLRSFEKAQKLFLCSCDRNECLTWKRIHRDRELRELRRLVDDREFEAALTYSTKYYPQGRVDHPEWNYLIAFCLHLLEKDLERALELYTKALEQGFDEFWVRYNRGLLQAKLGYIDPARDDLIRAVGLKPEHEGARQVLQQLSQKEGRMKP